MNPYDRYRIVAEAKGYETIELGIKALIKEDDSFDEENELVKLEFKKL